jgi:hypothetical protein
MLAALVGDGLLRGETLFRGDLGAMVRPGRHLFVRLAEGSGPFPIWNPAMAGGQPLAANPGWLLFHPLTWPFLFLPFEAAWLLSLLLPLLGAVVAMRSLARSCGSGRTPSLLAGLAWGFGGFLLSSLSPYPIALGSAVMPATLAAIVRLSRHGRPRSVASVALFASLELLAVDPGTLIATAILAPAAILEGIRRRSGGEPAGRTLLRRAPLLLSGALLAALLAGAMLLPGLPFARETGRAAGFTSGERSTWSLPLLRLAEVATPNVLSGHDPDGRWRWWGNLAYGKERAPYIASLYPGLAATLLALFALFRLPFLPWSVAGAVGLLLSLGSKAFLWPLTDRIPLLSSVRNPERFSAIWILVLCLAAARGGELLRDDGRRRRFALFAGGLAVAAIGAAFAISRLLPVTAVAPDPSFVLREGGKVALLALLVAAAARLPERFRLPAIVLLLGIDLVRAGRPLLPTVPPAALDPPPAWLEPALREPSHGRLFHAAQWNARAWGRPEVANPPLPAGFGIATVFEQDSDGTQLAWSRRLPDLFWPLFERDPALVAPLLESVGVGWIAAFAPDSPPGTTLVTEAGDLRLLRLDRGGSEIRCVDRLVRVDGEKGAIEALASLGSSIPSALVTFDPAAASLPPSPAPCRLSELRSSAERLEATIEATGGGSIVAVARTWWRRWSARVDGREVPIVRSALGFQAIPIPAGRHRLELACSDPRRGLGIFLSLIGVLVCIVLRGVRSASPPLREGSGPAGGS